MRRCGLGIDVDVGMSVGVGVDVGVVCSAVLPRPKASLDRRRVSTTKPSCDRMAYNDKSYRLSY